MKFNTQSWDDPTIQYFMWGDSSELKPKISNDQDQTIQTLEIKCISMMKFWYVWKFIYGYSSCRVGCPRFILSILKKKVEEKEGKNKRKKNEAYTMCDVKILSVTQKSCIPHNQIPIQWITNIIVRVNHILHQRVFGKLCMIRVC